MDIRFVLDYPLCGSDFKINKTKTAIRHKAKKLGLIANKEYKAKKVSERMRGVSIDFISKVNTDKFTYPDKYSSYILGILWGDGYVNKKTSAIVIEGVKTDLDEIEHIFDTTGEWNKYTRHRINRQESKSFHIASKKLHKLLTDFNYTEKSYLSSSIQDTIDTNITHYWWRGYFDADGCIYINNKNRLYQLTISSSYEQDWNFVEKLFINLSIKYTILRKENKSSKSSVIRVSNKKDCLKFLDYIYHGDIFGLSRKYKKYLEMKDTKN